MTEPTLPDHSEAVRRACLPELLLVVDVALALRISPSVARKAILLGECGPYLRIAGRLAVRRDSFIGALAARERHVPRANDDSDTEGSVA